MGIAMRSGTPAPFVSALVEAVDETIRAHRPSHGMSPRPRAWLAFGVTAVLVTNSRCWARCARASLGTDALAALSWRCRHRTMPWDARLVASVRVILRPYRLTCGRLVLDDPDTKRSQSAHTLAPLDKRREQESGGYSWGQRRLFRLVVTPAITLPVGFTVYQPAPELSAWAKQAKALKKQGVPPTERPPPPPPHPPYPTTHALALRR
jgi:hypothetical protein